MTDNKTLRDIEGLIKSHKDLDHTSLQIDISIIERTIAQAEERGYEKASKLSVITNLVATVNKARQEARQECIEEIRDKATTLAIDTSETKKEVVAKEKQE